MQPIINTTAKDFNTLTSERTYFTFSRLKGAPLILSFYTNEAFAIGNFRMQTLKKYTKKITGKDANIISVFRAMPKDILEFAGRSEPPFYLLADPMALVHDLYSVKAEEKKTCNTMMPKANTLIALATVKAMLTHSSKNNNDIKLSTDFLIDKDFVIRKVHYANDITDFLSVKEISEWVKQQYHVPVYNTPQSAEQLHHHKVA